MQTFDGKQKGSRTILEQPQRLRDSVRVCGILRKSRMRTHFLFATGALFHAPKLPQGDSVRG